MSTTWVSWLSGEVPIIKRFSPLASQCSHGWQAHLVLTQTININPAINISQTLTICLALTTNSTLIINLTLTTLNLTMNLTKLTIILTLETQLKHSFQELNKECTRDILGSLIIWKYQKKNDWHSGSQLYKSLLLLPALTVYSFQSSVKVFIRIWSSQGFLIVIDWHCDIRLEPWHWNDRGQGEYMYTADGYVYLCFSCHLWVVQREPQHSAQTLFHKRGSKSYML